MFWADLPSPGAQSTELTAALPVLSDAAFAQSPRFLLQHDQYYSIAATVQSQVARSADM